MRSVSAAGEQPPRPADVARVEPDDWEQAIARADGRQLIVAGPGTGKTEFLARRAAHLIRSGRAGLGEIVVLTFSRRAAGALRTRIGELVDEGTGVGRPGAGRPGAGRPGAGRPSAIRPWGTSPVDVGTFHAFCHRLLEARGPGPLPTILTTPEQVSLVGSLLQEEDPASWPLPFRPLLGSTAFAEEVADFMLRCREHLLDPGGLARRATERSDWGALPGFYARYDEALRSAGRFDYGALVTGAIELLVDDRRRETVGDVRYVLVDEYQDASPAQAELVETLAGPGGNLTVTGDPYQSIYSFRGADVDNVARFADRAPTQQIALTTSFRVPAEILEAAVAVTAGQQLPGSAGPVRPAPHRGSVESYVFDQRSAEAEWIASEVERLMVEQRVAPERIAVLVRSKRRLLTELSRALDRRHIDHDRPYRRLVDQPAVRMVLELARAAALVEGPPSAQDRAVRRVILSRFVSVGIAAERELLRERVRSGRPWSEVLAGVDDLRALARLLQDPSWATETPAAEGFWSVWTGLPLFRTVATDVGHAEDRAALASLAQTLSRQAERDPALTLAEYVRMTDTDDFEATPLLGTTRPADGRVVLTTLHQAKGLEYDTVFIADASEGVFPDPRRRRSLLRPRLLDPNAPAGDPEAGADEIRFRLQEETRLAYTAMTRARSRVVWTATAAGVDESEQRPSRFLMAVADLTGNGPPGPPPVRSRTPVTAGEIQAHLRRLASDPSAPGADRLASVRVLADERRRWRPERFAGFRPPGPDSGVVHPPLQLSPSQVDAYERCPRAYVLDRRLGLDGARSPYADFGILIHASLETAEREAGPGLGGSTVDDAIAAMDRHIEGMDFGTPVLRQAWRRRGVALLQALYASWPRDSHEPVALEHRLGMRIGETEWVGVADRVERIGPGRLRIVDYKTSSSPLSMREAATSLQLGFYVMAAAADPVLAELGRPVEAELWYPAALPRSWRRSFDMDNLDQIRHRLEAASEGIAEERWEARVSAACARCSVRLLCDRWPEGREAFVE